MAIYVELLNQFINTYVVLSSWKNNINLSKYITWLNFNEDDIMFER